MAYTQTVPVGRPFSMVQDVVYALPSGNWAFTAQGAGTVEWSNDQTTWASATSPVTAAWVRTHGGVKIIEINHA